MALTRPKIWDIDTNITQFSDPMTVLHQGSTQANVDVGFLFNRANGLVSNVALYWNEASQSMVVAYTSSTGATDTNVAVTSYANVTVGNITATAISLPTGDLNSNAAGLYNSILGANASIATINANIGSYYLWNNANATSLQTQITSNAALISGLQTQVTGNAAVLSTLQANVGGYYIWANANTAGLYSSILGANAAIVTANAAMKGYVDTANSVQSSQIATLQSQVYTNTNVAAYLPTYAGTIGAAASTVTIGGNLTVNGNFSVVGNITSVNYETVTNTEYVATLQATNVYAATIGNTGATLTGTLSTAAQPNVTSLGTLTGLTVNSTTTSPSNVLSVTGVVSAPHGSTASWYFQTEGSSLGSYNSRIQFPDSTYQYTAYPGTATALSLTTLTATTLTAATIGNTGAALVGSSLSVTGNASVSGNLSVGNINIASGNVTVSNSGSFIGNAVTGYGALYAGIPAGYSILPSTPLQIATNFNTYSQLNMQNINSGAQASSDYVVTADNGNDSTYYGDFGIASSTYNYPALGLTAVGANDTYLLGVGYNSFGPYTGNVGNVVISSSNGMIKLATGGANIANVVATVLGTRFAVNASTTSTSTTTGALTVAGGAGIAGNLFVGNVLTSGLYWSSNGAPMSTGGGSGTGITYTASTTAPIGPHVGDQWYYTTGDVLYEYQNVGTGSFWVDITGPQTITNGTVTVPGGGDLSPFLLMGA